MKLILLLLFSVLTAVVFAQHPPQIEEASSVEVYKNTTEAELNLWIFNPKLNNQKEASPAIVFFFGGGWNAGSPRQFVEHCTYLAKRGMVAIVADYRVATRHNVLANVCVSDAKSAVRWIRSHAARLNIDPDRIVAAGGSAGGHLAASTATLKGHDDTQDDLSVSAIPNALALFNPVVVLAPVKGESNISKNRAADLEKRLGSDGVSMSPFHHVKAGMPPSIIFHGTADKTVPFRSVELFHEKMKKFGNNSQLISYLGEEHGFFNVGTKSNSLFVDTVHHLDKFLVSIGYLNGANSIVID